MNLVGLSIFAVGANAGGWNRRVYYDALGCRGNMVHGIMVWQSPNCATSNPVVNSACEDKSTSNPLSSEGTSCETADQSSDSTYFPPQDQAGRASAYVVVNKYTSTACSGISTGFEQSTFAADGKCYADERGSYFRATCVGQTASVFTYCKDSSCNECSTDIYDGSCQTALNGLAVKSFCTGNTPQSNLNPPAPISQSASSPTSVTFAPMSSASSTATMSGTGKVTVSSSSPAQPGAQRNSVSSPDKTTLGFVAAILAALFL